MKKQKFKGLLYVWVIILWLFLILFLGKTVDPTTKETHRTIVSDGRNHFKKWLDVAGGTKLVYTINYDKYKDIYKDPAEFQSVKTRIEKIIRKNIDGRISKLGVSDYSSYYQTAWDKNYLVVEIGGILDLDQAKEVIGKTLELEFRLPSKEEPANVAIQERKKLANDVLTQILDNEDNFKQIVDERASENIFYGSYSGVTLAELPLIYQKHIKEVDSLWLNKVYPWLLEWTYAIIPWQQDPSHPSNTWAKDTELKGFTTFRVLDKKTIKKTEVTPQDIVALANQYNLKQQIHFQKDPSSPKKGKYSYDTNKKELNYYAADIAEGQEAYQLQIYSVAKKSTLWMSMEDAQAENKKHEDLVNKVKKMLQEGKNPLTIKWVDLIMDDWSDLATMQKNIPSYTGQAKGSIVDYAQGGGTRIIKAKDLKMPNETLAEFIVLDGVSPSIYQKIKANLTETTLYTIEDAFIQDRQMWVSAYDSKTNEILNGAYFEYASTSLSQIWEPVVSIKFDDKGKEIFCNITTENIGTPMAIFAGGKMLTSPVIQSKICGGTAQIDGWFTTESAQELANSLNEWTMPASLVLMQEEKISPTLWQNALRGTIIAAIIGIVVIIMLMRFMYGWRKALVTTGVLLTFVVALLWLIKLTSYALSLSGIAAIILSIGMWVDANILIYERVREEVKAWRTIKSAIEVGYERSRAPIRDGNLSTAIIAALLFVLGINMFKWFGMMMLINIVLILALNVPLTRVLLHKIFKHKSDYIQKSPMEKKMS